MFRSDPREIVEIHCSFRQGLQALQPIKVTDLTCAGCKLDHVPMEITQGDRIAIRIDTLAPIYGVVQWVKSGMGAGLKFEKPLHPAVFKSMLAKLRSENQATGYTPRSNAAPARFC
ncbi:PilZ domain-containing protein [Croceicoccus mobilis]|uniref:PilZ domain-containing protein n=1 Tax=Croceicoccus mobilis TaxID=1703339 RepID=A0A916YW81_9SPHN|nr:PilZ domain-containing protein [Croceicoccus mobilis]GGD64182.1 hypothetical protein GCM10010990_12070 [Croceicoccus mobilis]